MSEFKVGDRVRVLKPIYPAAVPTGAEGAVVSVKRGGGLDPNRPLFEVDVPDETAPDTVWPFYAEEIERV